MEPSTQPQPTSGPNPSNTPVIPSRNLLLDVPTARLDDTQRRTIQRILDEEAKALAEEKAWIVGRRNVDETRRADVERRITALENRLATEFGNRPELREHFRAIFTQHMDFALLQVATGEMRVLGRERREAMGLDRDGNESGAVADRDRYLDRPEIAAMLGRHSRARAYLLQLEQGNFDYTDQQYRTARWSAEQCWKAIDGIGFNSTRFRNATSGLTRYQLDLVYRYYAQKFSGGSNLMEDLRSQWSSGETEYNLIRFSNPRFNGDSTYYNRDPRLYGFLVDAEHLIEPYITTRNFTEVTSALLSQEPADVIAARLYMSLNNADALAVAIECFMNVRDEDRHAVLRAFYRRFGKTYSQLAGEQCELEEGIACRHLSEDGRVNEWEITRVVNDRAKRIGTEIGLARARESGEVGGIPYLEQRFQREVIDIYRNNPALVVRDEALRARITGMTLAELEQSSDPQFRQVVAQVNRRIELLTQIKDAQARVAQQAGMRDVVANLQQRLTMMERTPPEMGDKKHLERMLQERIDEYYRKQRRFFVDNPEFETSLRSFQRDVARRTNEAADRITKAIADIEAGSEKWYAFGTGLFTDNDKIYAALKTLKTKEEREMFALWYERKHKQSIGTLFDNEFSGAELDKANALLEGNLAKAAACDIYINMTSTWTNLFGRDSKKIESFIREVPPEDRAKIEEYFNQRYARQVTYTTTQYHSGGPSSRGGGYSTSTTHNCTSFRDAMSHLYRKDELDSCVALLNNNNTEYRLSAVHNLLSQTYVFSSPEKDIGKILEQFYEDSPFELDRESGEWRLTAARKAEIDAFVTEYNRRFNTDLRADLNRQCWSDGARWCNALLDGDLAAANAHKFRVAQSFWGNDRRMMMEIFEVPAGIQALPEHTARELREQGKGADIVDERQHDALVERRQRAIACQKALNARTETVYGELRPGRTFRADLRSELRFLNNSDGEVLYAVAIRGMDRGTYTDTERLCAETQHSTFWSGVDGARLAQLTRGKTKAELDKMRAEAAVILREAGSSHRTLDSLVLCHISGDNHFDVKMNMRGEPETVGELLENARLRRDYERSSVVMACWGERPMDKRYRELQKFAENLDHDKKLDELSAKDRARLNALNKNFQIEAENFRHFRNSVAEIATTLAVIAVSVAVTVATFGTAGPWLMMLYVAGASLLTTMATKALVRGSGFISLEHGINWREVATDVGFAVVDGALSAVGGKFLTPMVDKLANGFCKKFAGTWFNRCVLSRVPLLKGLKIDTIERALAAEGLIQEAIKKAANAPTKALKEVAIKEALALKSQARSLLLEHARSLTTDVFTSWVSSGIHTAATGDYKSVGDFFRLWAESTGDRLKYGVIANVASTRLMAAGEKFRISGTSNATLRSNADVAIHNEVIRLRTPVAPTPIAPDSPVARRPTDAADPHVVARGLADPHATGARPPVGATVHDHINHGHNQVAHLEAQLRGVVEGRIPVPVPADAGTPTRAIGPTRANSANPHDPHGVRTVAFDDARTALGLKPNDPALRDSVSLAAKKAEMIAAVPARATDANFNAHFDVLESCMPLGGGRKGALADLKKMGFRFAPDAELNNPTTLATERANALAHAANRRTQVETELARISGPKGTADVTVVNDVLTRLGLNPTEHSLKSPKDVAKLKAKLLDQASDARVNHAFNRLDANTPVALRAAALARLGLHEGHPALASNAALDNHIATCMPRQPHTDPQVMVQIRRTLALPETYHQAEAMLGVPKPPKRGSTPDPLKPQRPTNAAEVDRWVNRQIAREGLDPTGPRAQQLREAGAIFKQSFNTRAVNDACTVMGLTRKQVAGMSQSEFLDHYHTNAATKTGPAAAAYQRAAELLGARYHDAPPRMFSPCAARPTTHTDALAALGLHPGHPALASSTKLKEYIARLGLTDRTVHAAALRAAQDILLRTVPPDTVADCAALLNPGAGRRGAKLPTSRAELEALGNAAIARAGTDPDALFAVAVAVQRLNMMIPPTDVAGSCALIGGLNWQTNAGFRPLLESRAALKAWFDTLCQGAPKAYRDAAMKHFEMLSRVVPPSTVAEARTAVGRTPAGEIPRTRAEVVEAARARLAGPPPMDPSEHHAFSRAVEMMLESIPPQSLADHVYTLHLGDTQFDVHAARKPVLGTYLDTDAHANATAKLDALFKVATMPEPEAIRILLDHKAAGNLRDGHIFERHLDAVRRTATPQEIAEINSSATAVKDYIGKARYHVALDEFGLTAGSPELTNRKALRAVCERRLKGAHPDEHPRIKQHLEVLELHIPASRGWRMLSWCLRQVGIITVHEALTRLNLLSSTGLSPDALTPDGVRAAYRTQRAVYERNMAEAPTKSSQKYWKKYIARLDDALSVASRKLPFGSANPEICGALNTLGLPQSDHYSAVAIDRAANRALRAARGNVDLIAEINGARATLKQCLPDFPTRSWYDVRAYTTDLLLGRTVRGFQHAETGMLKQQVAIARQRCLDYQETLTAFGVGSTRKLPPTPQEVQRRLNALLAADPLKTPQSQARLRAMADLMNEIVSRRTLVDRLVARHVNADDLMVYANEGTQTTRTTSTKRGVDSRTDRLVPERTLADRARVYEELHNASADAATRLGLAPKRVYTATEIETARVKALNAAGDNKAALIQAQVDADLLLCLAGERPWSIPRGTRIGLAAETLTLRKTLTDLYTSVYDARIELGLNIRGNPFSVTYIKAALDGVDILAACNTALGKKGANVANVLAARDYLLAINDAHRSPWWSFGLRTSTGGGGKSVPSLETFRAYHESRCEAMKALGIPGSPRDGQPLYTERDLAIVRQRRLTGVTDTNQIARIEAAHDFLVSDLRAGKAEVRYVAKWRAYADTAGAPITLPLRISAAVLTWGVTKTLGIAWGLATFILPGKASAIAATYLKRFTVHIAEATYGLLGYLPGGRALQRGCDFTFGNARRAFWVLDEGATTSYRRTTAWVGDGVSNALGRRGVWSCDPTVESFQARVDSHTRRLVAVGQAENFLGTKLGDVNAVKGLTSLAKLDEHVQGLLKRTTHDGDRLRILAARDQVAQDIVHRQTGTLLGRDTIGAIYYTGRAYLIDYVIKIGAIRALLELIDAIKKMKNKLGVGIHMEGSEDCESDNDVFGITKEDVDRDPRLAPFLLADQDPYRAEISESMIEAFGGSRLSERDRERYARARNSRGARDYLARNGRDAPGGFDPMAWSAATNSSGGTYMPVDMQRWHSGSMLRADVTSSGYDPDPMGPRVSVRLLYEDELAAAVLPPRNARATRLDTSFEPSIGTFRAAGPNAPLPLSVADRAYRFMTLDLPGSLSPITNRANDVMSSLVVRPFRPTRLDESDAVRYGPLTLR